MIPVDVARTIADQYEKDMVVLLAYDHATETTDSVTWGRSISDKENVVCVGEKCLQAIGVDLNTGTTHQDYRFISEGERAQLVDELVAACRRADEVIANLITDPCNVSDQHLQEVRDKIECAIAAV